MYIWIITYIYEYSMQQRYITLKMDAHNSDINDLKKKDSFVLVLIP